MADAADTIAGFGFCTDDALPDLSDLDEQLARIEASGASHCELSLYELDLVAGGRFCRRAGASWSRSAPAARCATRCTACLP